MNEGGCGSGSRSGTPLVVFDLAAEVIAQHTNYQVDIINFNLEAQA